MNNEWTLDDGNKIYLITPEEYKKLPDGTKLIDIFGETFIKGIDIIDQDTRFGYIAFGLKND